MTNNELIETAKETMKDIWELNQGRLLRHEQTAYNCLRLFCERLEEMDKHAEKEAKAYASWLSNTVIRGRTASKLWDDYKAEIGPIIPA